jgi:RNA 2',3'-cyclic 3'-phosphodiesterase
LAPGTVERGERLRLFCALRLPDSAVAGVHAWAERELRGGRVVPPSNLHVTLAFLGGRPAAVLDAVAEELRAAAATAERPALRVRGYRETRSVGMLVLEDDDGRAAELADDVHRRLERIGVYERERRPWLAHLTVLRFRDRPRLRPPLPDAGEIYPSEAAVYHSVLRPTGAQYEVLHSFALGG